MASFVIEGGHRLCGEIHPQGAKNEVLQIICATLLTAEEVTVNNIPDILDVNNLIQLLREMGVTVAKKGIDSYSFKAENVDLAYLESDDFLKKCSSLRGSVMLIGPMVARFGKALISKPGGDKIGRRRLDTHFVGIQNLGADEYLKFVLLTGVTKFSQVSVFSGFNQPKDISMDERYESLCGITQEELEKYFAEPISRLATKYECTVEEMKDWLKRQYDGYHFSTNMAAIYNPFSILNAFDMNEIRDYWFATGTPTYLIRLLQHSREQMNELTGKFYDPTMFIDYKADVEQPLPMIFQSGYLTIKEYNKKMGTYLLDFPNNEVRKGFLSVLAANYMKPKSKEVTSWITDAVMDLERGDTDAFRRSLTSFLASIPYDSHGSLKDIDITEKHFQYTFYLLLRLIGVYCTAIHCEDRQSYGRVDCTLEMEDYVYIFEFKMDGTAQEALEQIEKTGYAKPYLADKRKVICIGVNFSSVTRTVEDWEEVSIV